MSRFLNAILKLVKKLLGFMRRVEYLKRFPRFLTKTKTKTTHNNHEKLTEFLKKSPGSLKELTVSEKLSGTLKT